MSVTLWGVALDVTEDRYKVLLYTEGAIVPGTWKIRLYQVHVYRVRLYQVHRGCDCTRYMENLIVPGTCIESAIVPGTSIESAIVKGDGAIVPVRTLLGFKPERAVM